MASGKPYVSAGNIGNPGEVSLEASHLDTTVGGDCFFDIFETLVDAVKTLIEDAGHGTAGVTAEFLSGFIVAFLDVVFDLVEEVVNIGGSHVEIDDTLDNESHTKDEADEHGGHPAGTTLDVLFFQYLVEGFVFGYFVGNGGNGSFGGLGYGSAIIGCYLFGLICSGSGSFLSANVVEIGECQ